MPSRAEMRIRGEQVLRGIVIVVLAVMLWRSLRERGNSAEENVSARGVSDGVLAEWSALAKAPPSIHVSLDSVPSRIDRAWLGALAGAGSSVTWSGDVAPIMIDVQPVASPSGGTKVLVSAPTGSAVVLSDEVGALDTVRAQSGGVMLALNATPDRLTARINGSAASTGETDSLLLHRILVIANAGWESKFAIAALEEEGWRVDADIHVAPSVDVTQGAAATIDTSRYSAVVALDASASPYASRILEFARTGGGVILSSQSASLDAMAPLRVGDVRGIPSESRPIQTDKSVGASALALTPVASLKSDAVALDKRAGAVAVATRRIGAGRVLQMGYQDTWRWRMSGNEGAVRDHRLWWSGLVASVAYAPRIQRVSDPAWTDEAPTAALVGAIGPSMPTAVVSPLSGKAGVWTTLLFLLLTLCLVAEVASRRLQGRA